MSFLLFFPESTQKAEVRTRTVVVAGLSVNKTKYNKCSFCTLNTGKEGSHYWTNEHAFPVVKYKLRVFFFSSVNRLLFLVWLNIACKILELFLHIFLFFFLVEISLLYKPLS